MQYFINDRYEVEVEGGKSASLRALFAAADMDDVWYAASKCAEGHGTRRCRAAMQGMQGWWQVTFRQVTPSSRRMTCEVSLLAWQQSRIHR